MLHLQFERGSVVYVVSDVLFVRQDLMNRSSRPRTAAVIQYTLAVKQRCDHALGHTLVQKESIDAMHDRYLFRRARHQHDAIGLDAFFLPVM